jgi:5'-deoxynucleotidase YfbR-like HD superfamily hydrolase
MNVETQWKFSIKLRRDRVKNEVKNISLNSINNFLDEVIKRTTSITRFSTRPFIRPQNLAEHHGNVTFIAMILSDYLSQNGFKIDVEKTMRLAITHDLDETVSSDIPHPAKYNYGNESEKLAEALKNLSEITIKGLLSKLHNKKMFDYYYNLYQEEKEKMTIESKIVKLADYIDVIIYSSLENSLGNKTILAEKSNAKKRFKALFNDILKNRR